MNLTHDDLQTLILLSVLGPARIQPTAPDAVRQRYTRLADLGLVVQVAPDTYALTDQGKLYIPDDDRPSGPVKLTIKRKRTDHDRE